MATTLERQFVWTVIPAGRTAAFTGSAERMAVCTLLLTPRLLGPGTGRLTVGQFGMQTWPERLAALRFDAFRGQQSVPVRRVPHVTAEKQSVQFTLAEQLSAWRTLFTAAGLVRPYLPTSYEGRTVHAFPTSEAAAEVRTVYGATARTYHEYRGATPETSAGLREALRRVSDMWQTGLRSLDGPEAGPSAGESALTRGYRFYQRNTPGFTPLTKAAAPPERDFHDLVAQLSDHPLLLRALGLLIDLAVPVSVLSQGDPRELRVVPRWPSPDPGAPPGWAGARQVDLSPSTAYSLVGQRFVPASVAGPAATLFKDGMLPLKDAGAGPSAASRFEVAPFDVDGAVLRLVGAARSDQASSVSGTASVPGILPALRSSGFALVERNREEEHGKQLRRARQRATSEGLLSSALTADSLVGGYRVDIQDVATGRWHSLCRRRVRYSIGGVPIGPGSAGSGLLEEGYLRPGLLTTGGGAADALYLHQTVARWDSWSMVARRPERIVDTGDAMPAAAPAAQPYEAVVKCEPGSLPRLRFGRAYRMRVRIADLAGGGLDGSEVRPGEEETKLFVHRRYEALPPPEIVPTRAFADGEGQDRMVIRSDRGVSAAAYATAHGHRSYDLRHLLAPKSSLELAMQYKGTFDAAMGPSATTAEVNRLFEVAKRADRGIADVPGAKNAGTAGSGATSPYVVLPETGVVLPWLADPGSSFVALNARPRPIDPDTGVAGKIQPPSTVIAVWSGTWPDLRPVALRLVAADSGCTITRSSDSLTLTVALGPAEQVTFDVPSCPRASDVQLFGVVAWMPGIDPGNPATFQDIVWGKNRLITPSRTITLVHAVQRPLRDPGGRLTARRNPGDTDALLVTAGNLALDIRSTGRIDIRADWTDQDDLPPAAPAPSKHTAHVGSYDVQHTGPRDALPPIRQEFGDTRHRRVRYTVTAVSRFRDCFAGAVAANAEACQATGVLADTHVPSSARPPAPKLLYTMPTFRWTRTTDGAQSVTQLRQGGGLRVFLERPWYASGDEEALAVLVWPTASAPDYLFPYISVAGRDPIRNTGAPPAVLTRGQFNAPGVAQADLPEAHRTLEALTHPVHFDEQRGRWYADLDLSPVVATSYLPFVRLALARYQPYTATGVPGLSPVVHTEPLQLPPHRRLVVTRSPGRATVIVDGVAPASAPNVIRTELQILNTGSATGSLTAADGAGWTTIFRTSAGLGQSHVVDIPAGGQRPLRIAVQEFETHPPPRSGSGSATEAPGRLVYADILPVAPS